MDPLQINIWSIKLAEGVEVREYQDIPISWHSHAASHVCRRSTAKHQTEDWEWKQLAMLVISSISLGNTSSLSSFVNNFQRHLLPHDLQNSDLAVLKIFPIVQGNIIQLNSTQPNRPRIGHHVKRLTLKISDPTIRSRSRSSHVCIHPSIYPKSQPRGAAYHQTIKTLISPRISSPLLIKTRWVSSVPQPHPNSLTSLFYSQPIP